MDAHGRAARGHAERVRRAVRRVARVHWTREQAAAARPSAPPSRRSRSRSRQRIEAEVEAGPPRADGPDQQANEKRVPKIVMNGRALGRPGVGGQAAHRGSTSRCDAARAALDAAGRAGARPTRTSASICPTRTCPRGRRIAALGDGDTVLRDPGTRAGGAGRAQRCRQDDAARAAGRPAPSCARARPRAPAHRPGRLPAAAARRPRRRRSTCVDNVALAAPDLDAGNDPQPARAGSSSRGDSVHRPVRTLSGGERFRVSLARLLLRPTRRRSSSCSTSRRTTSTSAPSTSSSRRSSRLPRSPARRQPRRRLRGPARADDRATAERRRSAPGGEGPVTAPGSPTGAGAGASRRG